MSDAEMAIISEKLGYNPFGDNLIEGLKEKIKHGISGCLTCPLLDMNNMCTIYDIRPMICRIFGLVKKMRCPHGCKPTKWLNDRQAAHFIDLADNLYGGGNISDRN
jgi:Fe-S-cluster containining protein